VFIARDMKHVPYTLRDPPREIEGYELAEYLQDQFRNALHIVASVLLSLITDQLSVPSVTSQF
jgi:hypothetical protein